MEFLIEKHIKENLREIGLLLVRIGAGAMMLFGHGIGKIENFEWLSENMLDGFLGLPGPVNAILVIVAEVVCSILLVCGALTRLAAGILVVAMAGATYYHLGPEGDPLFAMAEEACEDGSAELAVVFGLLFLVFAFTGPGKFSVDRLISNKLD